MTCASCAAGSSSGSTSSTASARASTTPPRRRRSISTPARVTPAELVAAVEGGGLRRRARGRGACCEQRAPGRAPGGRRGAHGAGRCARDGLRAAVRRLGMGRARADGAGRALGRLAVPSGHDRQRPPRRGDDGHADLARDAGGVRVVDRRPRCGPGRAHVLRGRRGDHHARSARPLPRASRAPPRR